MKNNGKKNMPAGSKDEFEHFTKILIEKMDSTVKTVTEQYGSIVKKIDNVASDVNDLKDDMAIMKPAVEQNCKDTQGIKTDIGELKKDMKEVKSELHSVKMAVMTVSHEAGDHEKRIKKVEEKVFV